MMAGGTRLDLENITEARIVGTQWGMRKYKCKIRLEIYSKTNDLIARSFCMLNLGVVGLFCQCFSLLAVAVKACQRRGSTVGQFRG